MEYSDGFEIQQNLIENEKRWNIAQKIAHIGHWDYDLGTRQFWGSEGAFDLLGIKRDRDTSYIPFNYIIRQISPCDRNKMKEMYRYLLEHNNHYDVEFQYQREEDSEIRTMHSVAELFWDVNGKPLKIIGVVQDITERIIYENKLKNKNEELNALYEEIFAADEELKQQLDETNKHKEWLALSETRYRTLVDNSSDCIYSCDLDGVFTAVNEAFCLLVNARREDIIGNKMKDFIILSEGERIDKWNNTVMHVLHKKKTLMYESHVMTTEGISYYNITISPILDFKKEVIGITGSNHDITAIKLNENKIKHLAYHDPLTDLPNRTLFFDRLKNAIDRSRRSKTKIAVLFFDMDNFKRINDTLGHSIGDELLVETAKRIAACMREYDTVARLSGDEFAVLLQNIEKVEDMLSIVQRIQQKFNVPFYLSENTIDLTTSIGIAMYPEDGDTPEDLLKNADTAMYKAKEQGRNKYLFFHFTMKEEIIRKIKIEKLFKKAIQHHEFVLHYQPQYVTKGKILRGFEALIRWNSPELGFIGPDDFISIAEESGQIVIIGEWVIQEACYMIKKMNERYQTDLIISINISLLQIRQKDFDQMVLGYIHDYQIQPHNIELEVTESLFIDNYDTALHALKNLKQAGVGIALDDFGTGYSSLSYLKKLPINLLKIDQAFVKEIDPINPQNDLTEPIISLVHKLGIETMAEGVETEEQLNYLIEAKCDYLQGFYLGRPVPEQEAEEFIKKLVL
ncbi:MAG: GGDEF domain-containing protein [Firmicutes bacterium HGW-Firmicutes-7]|nr:MAG: GGDEF domain-containing protein [Firmicutes bacterium HGW-Firmicutes-7]